MNPEKIHKDRTFKENEAISEEVKWIGFKKCDNRGKDRYFFKKPDNVFVEFRVDKGHKRYRVRNANVMDSSKNGFAVLVPKGEVELLRVLNIGDGVKDIAFFEVKAKIKKDGLVRHKTKVTQGKQKGYYIIGIEASDI